MTTIPSLGQWGPISDTIEGAINEATAKAEEALSRSGTSVAGAVDTFGDLTAHESAKDGLAFVVVDEVAMYVRDRTKPSGWVGPVPMQGAATDAAVAAAIPSAPAKAAVLDVTNDAYAAAVEVDATKHASLQAAINAAQGLGVPAVVKGGRTTYTVTAQVQVTASNITLDLTNSTVVPTFAGQAIRFAGTGRLSNIGVRGGRINLNGVGANGVGFNNCDDPFIIDTVIENGTGINGGAVGLGFCERAVVRGVRINNMPGGVTMEGSKWTTVSGCIIRDIKEVGILAYAQSNHCVITGNIIHGYQLSGVSGGGIQVYGTDHASVIGNAIKATAATLDRPKIRFRDSTNFTCSGNVVEGPNGEGIQVVTLGDIGGGAGYGSITGNTVRDSLGTGINVATGTGGTSTDLHPLAIVGNTVVGVRGTASVTGIRVTSGADAVVISGNLIDDIDGDGIVCSVTGSITGNTIRNPGRAIAGRPAIFITGGTATLVGNTCIDDQTVKTMAYGIWVHSGAVGARLMGNQSIGHTTQAVRTGAGVGPITAMLGESSATLVGFYGATPAAKPAVTGSRGGNTALDSLLSQLATLGLITNSTTA